MKIGFISDIHVDINEAYPIAEVLGDKVKKGLDCLVIAGDISNNIFTTLQFLDKLIPLTGNRVYFVPGNHDMWDQDHKAKDSYETYERYQTYPSCLINRCIDFDNEWVMMGDIGWYDYSYGNAVFSKEEFQRRSLGERTWMDSVHVHWQEPDENIHTDMLARMKANLTLNRGKKCIMITHMVTNPAFIVPEEQEEWKYFNAYLGSKEYGELFEQEQVKISVMGHVHYRKREKIGGVDYICPCLNYHSQWRSHSLEEEIDNALTVIEIE